MWSDSIEQIRSKSPLIHCITNYVTAKDVANGLLAIGASPVMADCVHEVEEISDRARGLVINMGTMDERKISSMVLAGRRAMKRGIPVVFDPVGVGASSYRLGIAGQLLEELRPTVIRGNASEIKALLGVQSTGKGVDVGSLDRIEKSNLIEAAEQIKSFSKAQKTMLVITGEFDLVSDGRQTAIIYNGHKQMSRMTGTGCILDGILAAFLAVEKENPFLAAVSGIAAVGLCGERACEQGGEKGMGSFRVAFFDALSQITDEEGRGGANIEIL